MALVMSTNVMSMHAQKHVGKAQRAMASSVAKMSSGMRVNNGSDDAAALGLSERLRNHVRSLAQAERNTQDGVSMLQIAEGALNEIHGLLDRMRELAVQSATGTYTGTGATLDDDRDRIQAEKAELANEITRISDTTEFAGRNMIGIDAGTYSFQVGIQGAASDTISVTFADTDAIALAVDNALVNVEDVVDARFAIDQIDAAIQTVSSRRSTIGAALNRLDATLKNLAAQRENTSVAYSRVRDVDVAQESADLARTQILSQGSQAMLSQANQIPSSALSLVGG